MSHTRIPRTVRRSVALAHALGLGCLIVAAPAQARKNVPQFELQFRPTQVVGTPDSRFDASAFDAPFRLALTDRRGPAASDLIGTRTDDDDRRFELRATNDVLEWTDDAVRKILAGWGVALDPEAERVLEVDLLVLDVDETNQAVGASYTGSARLRLRILDSAGDAQGNAVVGSGESSRYGKKFSATNANETLSDALIDAVAVALNEPGLYGASPDPASAETVSSNEDSAMDPESLRRELLRLQGSGVGASTVWAYLNGRRLSRPLSVDDVLAWKESGIQESMIERALGLPVDNQNQGVRE